MDDFNRLRRMGCVVVLLAVRTASVPTLADETPQKEAWSDRSPHVSRFVQLDAVRLHYLDWGGRGDAILFLHGMGDTAHVFDDLAPRFADEYRVLGLTRRGHGRSDKPKMGYDTRTLVADIRGFLDALKIDKVHLVGHSLAGDEMTLFAALYPGRVGKMIYLDAAGDRATLAPFPVSSVPEASLASLDAYRNHVRGLKQGVWSEAMEANLRDGIAIQPDGTVSDVMPRSIEKALLRGSIESNADYTRVKHPTLSFHTVLTAIPELPSEMEAMRQFLERLQRWQNDQIRLFKMAGPHIRVIEMPGAPHYFFISEPEETVREMKAFL